MADKYRFDEVARSERYFVATILAHFLLSNNFAGLKRLFQTVFGASACSNLGDDIELVSELDPLRDGSVNNAEVKKLYREFRRIAVPDLFLRWANLCLVIEAKFFTDPPQEELREQIGLQRKAIDHVKAFTIYRDWEIRFALLTLTPIKNPPDDVIPMTWDQIVEMMTNVGGGSLDLEYCRNLIQKAKERALREFSYAGPSGYEKMRFDELLNRLPQLIKEGRIFIGFTGGSRALSLASMHDLVERSHFKVSHKSWSDNWISLDQLLHRFFELQGYYDTDAM